MKVRLYVVGKTRSEYLRAAEQDFIARIKNYCDIQIVQIKEEKIMPGKSAQVIKAAEAQRIIVKLAPGYQIVVLSLDGQQYSSPEFADYFQRQMNLGADKFAFIIGGPLGLPDDFLKGTALYLSLSKMTFTHEICSFILLEQIYCAFTIMRNEKYHR